jgi:hypothetical protein
VIVAPRRGGGAATVGHGGRAATVRRARLAQAAFVVALAGGAIVAWRYHLLGLSLSHYDARGHLVVARRIIDSLTPGWQQIGAVWLPLPHVLNAVPVQVDAFYRTGASAIAISVLAFAASVSAIAWIVAALTGSVVAALLAAAVFGLNPNVLYLQSTPMTEPLLIALVLLSAALLIRVCEERSEGSGSRRIDMLTGTALALASMTRYEAWPVTGVALAITAWAMRSQGVSWRDAAARVARLAAYPTVAIAGFLLFSRIVGGEWFPNDFFVPENDAQGHPLIAVDEIVWGLRELSGRGLVAAALLGVAVVAAAAARGHTRVLLTLALAATACVPLVAFVEGHPYRIRYVVPLIAAEAVLAGVAAGWFRKTRAIAALALAALIGVELRPLNQTAPMVVEAQWDRPSARERQRVSACLQSSYDGSTIMASMGSLGHYMQELSSHGFALRDFLHEGNGDIWLNALITPRPYAGWLLIEEKAEGGDMLLKRTRENPSFLDGFSRVCEGAGVALYRRERRSLHETAKIGY